MSITAQSSLVREPAGKWVRVSTGGQDEQNQVPDLDRYGDARGYEYVITYQLHDRSASRGEQQAELDRAIADMRSGRIKVLVAWHSDRLERRGVLATFDLVTKAREAGGRIESVQEPHFGILGDVSSEAMTALNAIMSQQESAKKRERMRIAREHIADNGGHAGRTPFGYVLAGPKYKRELIPTDEGKRLVPEIFGRIVAGESLATVAKWLRVETGRNWYARTVGQMIRNPTYMGQHSARDKNGYGEVIHKNESLVDAQLWHRAGKRLDAAPQRGPMTGHRAMAEGALRCPKCDAPMHRIYCQNKRKDGTVRKPAYYYCHGHKPDYKGCGNMVSLATVDNAINKIVTTEFRIPVVARTLIPGHNWESEITALRYERGHLASDMGEDEYMATVAALTAEIKRLQSLPAVPDTWVDRDTGVTYSDEWERTSEDERGRWLASHGFTVTASKAEVTVSHGKAWVTLAV